MITPLARFWATRQRRGAATTRLPLDQRERLGVGEATGQEAEESLSSSARASVAPQSTVRVKKSTRAAPSSVDSTTDPSSTSGVPSTATQTHTRPSIRISARPSPKPETKEVDEVIQKARAKAAWRVKKYRRDESIRASPLAAVTLTGVSSSADSTKSRSSASSTTGPSSVGKRTSSAGLKDYNRTVKISSAPLSLPSVVRSTRARSTETPAPSPAAPQQQEAIKISAAAKGVDTADEIQRKGAPVVGATRLNTPQVINKSTRISALSAAAITAGAVPIRTEEKKAEQKQTTFLNGHRAATARLQVQHVDGNQNRSKVPSLAASSTKISAPPSIRINVHPSSTNTVSPANAARFTKSKAPAPSSTPTANEQEARKIRKAVQVVGQKVKSPSSSASGGAPPTAAHTHTPTGTPTRTSARPSPKAKTKKVEHEQAAMNKAAEQHRLLQARKDFAEKLRKATQKRAAKDKLDRSHF